MQSLRTRVDLEVRGFLSSSQVLRVRAWFSVSCFLFGIRGEQDSFGEGGLPLSPRLDRQHQTLKNLNLNPVPGLIVRRATLRS